MKKYLVRFGVLVLAFLVGTTFIYLTAWEQITDLIAPKSKHSIENGSPFSTIDKNKITVKPFNASFNIPEKWLEYAREKNIFLNCGEIEKISFEYGINFDEEDGQVMDAVMPFENCAANFGDKGWGNGNWNDIQSRVYVTNMTLDEVSERIENAGLNKALSVFEKASVKSYEYSDWQHKSLEVLDAPTHFILFKEICFYYRSFDDKTVVFTFLHADRYENEINLILSSFEWQTKNNKHLEKKSQKK